MPRTFPVLRWLTLALRITLLIGVFLAAFRGHYLDALATAGIVVVTLFPSMLGKRFAVRIPPEFEVLAVVFIYASLFLGEVRGYYIRFWWWDVILHAGSGFLLGILGFLLVHVLNELDDVELHMRPRFVALFAFLFAVGMGTLWEIFEFTVDQSLGLNMQKSGLIDTMSDLMVDTAGALLVALLGWSYLGKSGSDSFLERWIDTFISANPRLFGLRDHDRS